MIINIHAGHNPDGKVACGAVGIIRESTEARTVKNEVITRLRSLGHTVYDCTVDDGTSQNDVLIKIVNKCNAHKVDLDVSIHFNSGANDKAGNGATTGVEVLVYSLSGKSKPYADRTANAIAALGFKNRGVKARTDLYFLRKTSSPAMLIECCFVDDADDVKLYDYQTMARAIVKGITGESVAVKTINPYTEPTVTIKNGSKGEGAKWVQFELVEAGYSLTIDGIFGAKSVEALKSFQSKNGLVADGLCGAKTREKLKEN